MWDHPEEELKVEFLWTFANHLTSIVPPKFSPTYYQEEAQEQIEALRTVVEDLEVDLKEIEEEVLLELEAAHHNMLQEEISLWVLPETPLHERVIEFGWKKDQTIVSGIQPRISVEWELQDL